MKILWMTGVIYATELSVLILPSTPTVAAVFEHAVDSKRGSLAICYRPQLQELEQSE
jgi:hypothetical protein